MRAVWCLPLCLPVALAVGGCSTVFGLDELRGPVAEDTSAEDAPVVDTTVQDSLADTRVDDANDSTVGDTPMVDTAVADAAIDSAEDATVADTVAQDTTVTDTTVTPPDTQPADTGGTADACASAADAGSTAKPYTDFIWALWPLAPDSPGSSNYTVATTCGDKVVTDKTTSLMWAQDEEPGTYTWADAKMRCTSSRRAGFTDWRLPTRIELVSLVDFGKTMAPTIDTTAFPGATNRAMWSSSPYALSSGGAWGVGFSYGGTNNYDVTDTNGVRCVR